MDSSEYAITHLNILPHHQLSRQNHQRATIHQLLVGLHIGTKPLNISRYGTLKMNTLVYLALGSVISMMRETIRNRDLENHPSTLLGIVAFDVEENTWAAPRRGGTPSFKVGS